MDCLRSFNLNIRQTGTIIVPDVKTWFVGAQEFWVVTLTRNSTFDIEGFKNINLYKMAVYGDVYPQVAAGTGGGIVGNWSFDLSLTGQLPLVSGKVNTTDTNFWNIDTNASANKTFTLSRNNNVIEFDSPIDSLKKINFVALKAQGNGGQTAGVLNLVWDFTFLFYYKYEGE